MFYFKSKIVFYFLWVGLFFLCLVSLYLYIPGIFFLHDESINDRYIQYFKSCEEESRTDLVSENLFDSYFSVFDKNQMEDIKAIDCSKDSIFCAEKYLIIANQVSLSISKNAKNFNDADEYAKTSLKLIGLSKNIIGDDLMVYASMELLSANLAKIGFYKGATAVSIVMGEQKKAKSRYECFIANHIFFSNLADNYFYSGEYFNAIYIYRDLLNTKYKDLL